MKLRGGILTFYKNFSSDPKIKKNLNNFKLYLATKKTPIGNGKNSYIRIDGVYFHKFCSNDKVNKILNNLFFNRKLIFNYNKSKKAIFQSQFSKESFLKVIEPKKLIPNAIILNGTKLDTINKNQKHNNKKLKIITCSLDYPIKRLHYFSELEKLLIEKNFDYEIDIITDEISLEQRLISKFQNFNKFSNFSNKTRILKKLSKKDIVNCLKQADIYVTFSHIDPCPNSIIEAVALGLPIIGPNSGGIKELCPNDLLYEKKIREKYLNFFSYEKIDILEVQKVYEKIILFNKNRQKYYKQLINFQNYNSYSRMLEQYLEFFDLHN